MIDIGRKVLSEADCKYVLSQDERSGDNGQIQIPKKICDELGWYWTEQVKEVDVVINKVNLFFALKFTQVYNKTEIYNKGVRILFDDSWYSEQLLKIESHFGKSDSATYKLHYYLSPGNQYYVNVLTQKSGLNIQEFLISQYSCLIFKKNQDEIIIEIDQDQTNLRSFCFNVFKIMVKEFGEGFLKNNSEEVEAKVGDFSYTGIIFKGFFGNSKLLGVFEYGQGVDVINSNNRFRYQKIPLEILYENKGVYFTTEFEFNKSNDSNINFENYKQFIEAYSENSYSIGKDEDGRYVLVNGSNSYETKRLVLENKSLREFAFQTFKKLHSEFGDGFLTQEKLFSNRKHGENDFVAVTFPNYFGNKKILGIFKNIQTKESLKTANSMRFNPENLQILNQEYIYFSSQWSYPQDPTHPNFIELERFVIDYGEGIFWIQYDKEDSVYKLYREKNISKNIKIMPQQKIFFGPPGSGKSYQIKREYGNDWPRVTFHPELDFQGFIGSYKPYMVDGKISYQFIPEAFTRAYCDAWKSRDPYYLIIEEINRGNCAQIFGDIFQLLDRNNSGYSEYPIVCSPDIQDYLKNELCEIERFQEYVSLTKCKDFSRMILPNNLNILCTMNTSDQSLFPMDSAFKRRWEWQYIPINYQDASKYLVDLGERGTINWGDFIMRINKKIRNHTQSEDKQLGNRFVSPSKGIIISIEEFVSKVIFYLWSEIYKDEQGSGESIFYIGNDIEITFSDFFKDGKVNADIVRKFIDYNLQTENHV